LEQLGCWLTRACQTGKLPISCTTLWCIHWWMAFPWSNSTDWTFHHLDTGGQLKYNTNVMSEDVPNTFIQTPMPDDNKKVIMKISGVLVHLMVEQAPEIYGPCVTHEKDKKVMCVALLKALHRMLVSSLVLYNKFKKDLEGCGFVFNPCDPCVANKMVNGKQHTTRFHVDDPMCSHVDPEVNTKFLKWLKSKWGTYGEVKATRGKLHEHLGIQFDYSKPGHVVIGMTKHMKAMVDDSQ